MNEALKLSYPGARMIQHFEGCLEPHENFFRAYKCPANVLTIGWGHTNHHGRQFNASTRWTAEECHEVFLEIWAALKKTLKSWSKSP